MDSEKGKYIYSIIKQGAYESFGSIGINNRQLELLNYKDITAVVSSSLVIDFDRLDKKELTSYIATHQRVNEKVMGNYDVVPMTFGTIAPSESEALSILERAYLQFKTALKRIEDKAEFAVQVWWNQKKLVEELVKTNQDIQKLKEEASSEGGPITVSIRLKLGKLIHEQVEAHRKRYIRDIQAFLESLSLESASNKLIDDDMIANFSQLIGRDKEPELDRKMQVLGEKYEGKLRFKYIGPMPPYSFVSIKLSLGNFELVDEARKLLGLGEKTTFDEIKRAYYTLAHQYHPDKYQDNEDKQDHMKKIVQAYRVLKNYCLSCDEFMGKVEGRRYSFEEEDIKNSLILESSPAAGGV